MEVGLVLGVAKTLYAALTNKEVRELCSILSYQSKFEALQSTVETIQNVLLDVESNQKQLNNQGLDWVRKLKDAVYDADDLFDELATIAKQRKIMPDGKISKPVRAFFSNENQLLFAVRTSRKIKKIRDRLDSIAKDRSQFGFSNVFRPVKRKEESWSYVHEDSIIGREPDKEAVIDMLLRDSDSSVDNVSFVSIVGMGGLGKTALAQLVYNDVRIDDEFDLKLWVCVSDEFSIKEILHKMLESVAVAAQNPGDLGCDGLQKNVRRCIERIKYFLILDDMWNESRDEWLKLREFLQVGARGSRVLVTTRSGTVARAIGDDPIHTLSGLSDDDSWSLFKRVAFDQGVQEVDDDLDAIGADIMKKCANVSLAIRVVGSMLYGHEKSKWKLFQKSELPEMVRGEKSIMPILKFSYNHLPPQLKTCFSYCALFPKDYDIRKQLIIRLWSAQGYLEPTNDKQNVEEVGEDYFSTLLHRCFLQNIRKNHYDEIYSCKLHDLMHDLAHEVIGKESYLMEEETSTYPYDGKLRHLSISVWRSPVLLSPDNAFGKLRAMRTFLRPSYRQLDCESQVTTILAKCKRLRVLDLHKLSIKSLPCKINNLLHLRYLDLAFNAELEMLPESISSLHNLQVLYLDRCSNLKELPKDMRKLVNLKHLSITYCNKLTHMPAGMDSMTSLRSLTNYVLGPESSKKGQMGQLRDLVPLINLKGPLAIIFRKGCTYDTSNVEEGAFLSNKEHIKVLRIEEDVQNPKEVMVVDERLLERLEPHHDLREIEIHGYIGVTLPRWAATLDISLPRLLGISLKHFNGLQHLPPLSQLQHLKNLSLINMPNLEFIENDEGASSFPSLENLDLVNCPSLKSFPECPHVKRIHLSGLNEALTFCKRRDDVAIANTPSFFSSFSSSRSNNNNSAADVVFDLQALHIDNLLLLKSLFGKSLQSIVHLTLCNLGVENLPSVIQEYHHKYAFSIRSLMFYCCQNLKSLSGGGIDHLTKLEELKIWKCHSLELEEQQGFPWGNLHNLVDLNLSELPQLVHLPKGIQYITYLHFLTINDCENFEDLLGWLDFLKYLRSLEIIKCPKLKSLPEAILPSLTKLHISSCDGLKTRYSEPNGTDFSKISHISELRLYF